MGRWLDRFGWTFDLLPGYLAEEIPYLANRGGEALRALVAACILDHDDIATLALSIEGLKAVMEYACDGRQNPQEAAARSCLTRSSTCARSGTPCIGEASGPFPTSSSCRVFLRTTRHPAGESSRTCKRHRRMTRGWIKVVLGQGARDPWAVVQSRMRDVLLRTDLWSDQILVLRAVQTLTMLDLQHNCELVWSLGGYTRTDQAGIEPNSGPTQTDLPGQSHEVGQPLGLCPITTLLAGDRPIWR